MKAWSVLGLLVGTAMFATIPISPQVTPSGLELSVDHAQAITYGHYRRVHRGVQTCLPPGLLWCFVLGPVRLS
jgi:hypothetical protein